MIGDLSPDRSAIKSPPTPVDQYRFEPGSGRVRLGVSYPLDTETGPLGDQEPSARH
jgi:hypothetical protein